jgi:hypothetical protein
MALCTGYWLLAGCWLLAALATGYWLLATPNTGLRSGYWWLLIAIIDHSSFVRRSATGYDLLSPLHSATNAWCTPDRSGKVVSFPHYAAGDSGSAVALAPHLNDVRMPYSPSPAALRYMMRACDPEHHFAVWYC